jgi:hypothetical protein
MACISKNNDGKALERGHKPCPLEHSYRSSIRHGISLEKMIFYEHDKISNGYQCYDARVLQGVQAAEERKGNYNKPSNISNENVPNQIKRRIHKASNPKMSINKKGDGVCTLIEPSNNTWHEISDNDQVADAHAKTFDCNGSVEYNSRIWISDL